MDRICLVVHRYGKKIVGGSEQLARCYAQMWHRHGLNVEVATTCASDYLTWRNEMPAGQSNEEGITVRRFAVDFERTEYWHRLHHTLFLRHLLGWAGQNAGLGAENWPVLWMEPARKQRLKEAVARLPRAVQEEFICRQGPYSTGLLQFLESAHADYDRIIFFTYLYPTTYFGQQKVPREQRILVPTLHDEPYAYLPVFRDMMEGFDHFIFLTRGEHLLANAICGMSLPGEVIGMPVEEKIHSESAQPLPYPYLLYCGRVERAKGTDTLFDYFVRYKQEFPSELKLVLTGHAVEGVREHPDIVFLGFVDEEYKSALMKNAAAFVNPSPFESLSIVLLEAFRSGIPALVRADSVVMSEQCRTANAGLEYKDYEEFCECVSLLMGDAQLRKRLGENGKRYAEQNYSPEIIAEKLLRSVGKTASPGRSSVPKEPDRLEKVEQTPDNGRPLPSAVRSSKTFPSATIQGDLHLRGKVDQKLLDQLHDYLRESIVTPEARTELWGYIEEAFLRFVNTICLVPEGSGALLELGANPYFLTLLLKKFRRYNLELANFFSDNLAYQPGEICEQEIINTRYGEHHRFSYRVFNIEKDVFPYADASFDVVLFCEIIEHLVSAPVVVLEQIHRVLKPGGFLVLTTPNVARRENVCRLLEGENIYDPYSRYGIYGRHNREYTTKELRELLTNVGFQVEQICTRDVHPNSALCENSRVRISRQDVGQYIFTRSRKAGEFSRYHPNWLYR